MARATQLVRSWARSGNRWAAAESLSLGSAALCPLPSDPPTGSNLPDTCSFHPFSYQPSVAFLATESCSHDCALPFAPCSLVLWPLFTYTLRPPPSLGPCRKRSRSPVSGASASQQRGSSSTSCHRPCPHTLPVPAVLGGYLLPQHWIPPSAHPRTGPPLSSCLPLSAPWRLFWSPVLKSRKAMPASRDLLPTPATMPFAPANSAPQGNCLPSVSCFPFLTLLTLLQAGICPSTAQKGSPITSLYREEAATWRS